MTDKTVQTFNKSDFLNAKQLAEKLGYPIEIIEKALKLEMLKGTQVKVNSGTRDMVIRATWSHRNKAGMQYPLRLHPLGMEKFIEILKKGNNK